VNRGAACLLAMALMASLSACASRPAPRLSDIRPSEPHWQDVFDTMPELFVVVRPQALRRDQVYGALLGRMIEVARQQSRVAAATRAFEAMEDADEIVVGIWIGSPNHLEEQVLVARGVPAELDPAKLVDAHGQALWAPGPAGPVRELVRERDDDGTPINASLFELPERTWIIASGGARTRIREVLAHPMNRPAIDIDRDALAIVRLDGPSLVARAHPLQGTGGLAAVGRRLQSVTVVLPPGKDVSIHATLSYADEDAAAFAEIAIRETIATFARTKPAGFAWLGAANVERPGTRVIITAPVPFSVDFPGSMRAP
jgi:hypothetical protein